MNNNTSTYRVTGTAGDVGKPGAPILHFDLIVVAATGSVSGIAVITQAVASPGGSIEVQVTGQVRPAGLGSITQLVAFSGTYVYDFPPPAIGHLQAHLSAHFAVDAAWNGRGGFTYLGHQIDDVPVAAQR